MDDDSHVIDKGWDALPDYTKSGDADDAVTLSISTTPGEWLVNTSDAVVVPMSMAEVVEALRAHKLNERSLVWRAGMQEWAPIDKVPQLKLAARLPATMAGSSPPAAAPQAAPSSPPPSAAAHGRPASKTPPARPSQQPPNQLSRRSTLPFGMPSPHGPTTRPSQPRLSSPVSAPPPPSEEQVLAVYSRPAATISFDLSPSEPARAPPPAAPPAPTPPPQTLAPTTSDARRPVRSLPPPSSADLSVVAASQFRAVQKSSKRLVWVSSLASAAAASVLTLWLSGAAPWTRLAAKAPQSAPAAGVPVAARLQPPSPVAAPVATPVTATAPSVPSAAPSASAAPAAAPPSEPKAPKAPSLSAAVAAASKPARKPKAVTVAPAPAPVADAAVRQPGAEPNPYDVKLDEAGATEPAAKPATPGLLDMMKQSEQKDTEVKQPEASAATGSSSPGF